MDSWPSLSALSRTWHVSLRSVSFARVPAVCRVATKGSYELTRHRRRPDGESGVGRDPGGEWSTPPRRGRRRTLVIVRLQRQVVDYALKRRSLLAEVYSGRTGVTEVCDANPYLLRAAKYHGKPSSVMCPICRKEQLTLVSWVFGDHLGAVSGSARTTEELVLLAARFDEFAVHVVEVCRTCSWNHLVKSYVLGARARRRRAAHGRRAQARVRPVNSEGRHTRSADDVREGPVAGDVSDGADAPSDVQSAPTSRPAGPPRRPAGQPAARRPQDHGAARRAARG